MKSLMAQKIKKARLHRRMSQVQLNKQAELCPGHISKLESGGNHIPPPIAYQMQFYHSK